MTYVYPCFPLSLSTYLLIMRVTPTGATPDDPIVPANQAKRNRIGWALALISTIAFSFAPPIARSAIQSGLDPTALVVARLVVAALLVGGTIAFTDLNLLKLDRRAITIACIAGAVNGFGMLLFFQALIHVHASMASMIISINPLVVLSLLALRGERFTHRHTLRLALGIGGVYLVVGPGGAVNPTGVLFLLIAVLAFANHMVMLQWFLRGYDARSVTFYISISMALVVTLWWWFQGGIWQAPGLRGWAAIGALALVSTYLARFALVAAVARIGGSQMAMLAPVETLFTVTWSMLFLGERLSPLQWVGGALILTSALLAIQRLDRSQWRPRWRTWIRT